MVFYIMGALIHSVVLPFCKCEGKKFSKIRKKEKLNRKSLGMQSSGAATARNIYIKKQYNHYRYNLL